MYIFDCKECGGHNEVNTGRTYMTCAYCGKRITLPSAQDEERIKKMNRANYYRRHGEYDKAIQAFSGIVSQNSGDPEATWGLLLAKYGIEYVEDPRTGERIPTCNRMSADSILTDGDYLATLDNSKDEYTRSLYVKEAERIDKIQKGILAIAKLEEPFDVFICYKETTGGGTRTEDSILAQDIYDKLTKEGLRVFFSRITLEDKMGQQYEPYIFAALNSAIVMLVVATDADNVNSVWVKNEWSRFLTVMHSDSRKMIIPCYKKMDIYDFPEELSLYQGIDMSKLGAMQDLAHIVAKSCKRGTETMNVGSSASPVNPNTESLYRRACLFLEDKDFAKANEYFDRILDIDPELAKAYMGKVLAAQRACNEEQLISCGSDIKDSADYEKAVRFAKGEEKNRYEMLPDRIKRQRENTEKEKQYQSIIRDKKWAPGAQHMRRIATRFRELGDYKDALSQAEECERLATERDRIESERTQKENLAKQERIRSEQEKVYKQAESMMPRAKSSTDLYKIADAYASIEKYEDSRTKKERCIALAKEQERLETFRARGVCQHCGGSFRGLFNKVCRTCGKPKDY